MSNLKNTCSRFWNLPHECFPQKYVLRCRPVIETCYIS